MIGENTVTKFSHSSIPLQMLVYFSYHYTPFFFFINLCLYTYKAVRYYYPGRLLGWELTTVFLFLFIDGIRLVLASKGNKTSTMPSLGASLLLSLPMIVLHSYYIALQTYILRVDIVINAVAFFLLGSEMILCGLVMMNIFLASRKF